MTIHVLTCEPLSHGIVGVVLFEFYRQRIRTIGQP